MNPIHKIIIIISIVIPYSIYSILKNEPITNPAIT